MPAPDQETRPLPSDDEIIASIARLATETLDLPADRFQDKIGPDDSLVTALELDSVTRLELLFAVEETYDITIDLEDGVRLDTVRDLVQIIQKYLSENRAD